jgi:hypothetical protein
VAVEEKLHVAAGKAFGQTPEADDVVVDRL